MKNYQCHNLEAISRTGMVTSPHWLATEAGAAVLERGGNAIEALVAAGAALSVVYPHFCGLGGDAIWMICDASGETEVFSGIGQAAQNIAGIEAIPLRGPRSTLTTACLVDSWDAVLSYSAQSWNGRETLPALLKDAIVLAGNGFNASASQQFWRRFRHQESSAWPGFQKIFVEEGLQRQTDLAKTLSEIADNGPRYFYEGDLANRIVKGLKDAGSPISMTDLARTRTRRSAPVRMDYRDVTLLAPPPPTQGTTTLGIMGVLGQLPISTLPKDSPSYYHYLIEAVKQAFLDREKIADLGDEWLGLVDELLALKRLEIKAKAVKSEEALPWPHPYDHGDTAHLAAVDSQGRCVSLLQSIYFDWGSGIVAGDTGILWQNRGAAFSTDPNHRNVLKAGKRPFYTLNPGIALRDGKPYLIYGTQGADGQPQTLALLLSLLIDHDAGLIEALSSPRFLVGKTFSDSRESVKIESNLGESAISRLSDLGHEISSIEPLSQIAGQAGVIRISGDGGIQGAHDPRSDGGAIGL